MASLLLDTLTAWALISGLYALFFVHMHYTPWLLAVARGYKRRGFPHKAKTANDLRLKIDSMQDGSWRQLKLYAIVMVLAPLFALADILLIFVALDGTKE